jgi:aminopeptidase
MLDFDTQLDNYANLLIIQGINVQPGQVVYINGEIIHRDLMYRAARAAYQRGASYVCIDFTDPYQSRLRLLETSDKANLAYVPPFLVKKFDDMVDEKAAILRIIGSEEPDALADLDPADVHNVQMHYRRSLRRFYQEGIGRSQLHWTIGAAATPKWAQQVLPDLPADEAYKQLWQQLFTICRVDTPDYLKRWEDHNNTLHRRAKALTELKIKELHFSGPGTDLYVGLSQKARFQGGSGKGPYEVEFEANIPTEECFTTPDWRQTRGRVKTTRPFFINNQLIEGLELTFENGEIVDFSAKKGQSTFAEYIASDAGAKRLGEVALVGIDSPIYQSGLVFRETLLDENAACHIAIGFAYRFCLEGGTEMDDSQLESLGCNTSSTHSDMMISSADVDVTALTYNNERIVLISNGRWVE